MNVVIYEHDEFMKDDLIFNAAYVAIVALAIFLIKDKENILFPLVVAVLAYIIMLQAWTLSPYTPVTSLVTEDGVTTR